jgi:hypothetical protein
MTCDRVSLPGGVTAIVCSPTKRCKCGRRAPLACDWKMPSRKSGTCDAPICDQHTFSPAPGKDLCPTHAIAFDKWKAGRG